MTYMQYYLHNFFRVLLFLQPKTLKVTASDLHIELKSRLLPASLPHKHHLLGQTGKQRT